MSTLQVSCQQATAVTETLSAAEAPAIPSAAQRQLNHSYPSVSGVFDSTTSPVPSVVISQTYVVGAGTTVIDLTAAPRARDAADVVDLTGKRLGGYKMLAPKTNTGLVTIKQHATNGYNFTGISGGGHVLERGQMAGTDRDQTPSGVTITPNTPLVAGGAKQLDLSGTVPADTFTMLMWFV